MANTRYQKEVVEDWIRAQYLNPLLRQPCGKAFLPCADGGRFECDAVSTDGTTAAMITTSGARAAGGRRAAGSVQKVQLDVQNLSRVLGPSRRLLLCTQPDMYKGLVEQQRRGRLPASVEIQLVVLPSDIREQLDHHRQISIDEQRGKGRLTRA